MFLIMQYIEIHILLRMSPVFVTLYKIPNIESHFIFAQSITIIMHLLVL